MTNERGVFFDMRVLGEDPPGGNFSYKYILLYIYQNLTEGVGAYQKKTPLTFAI